jgi:hypothetical protein
MFSILVYRRKKNECHKIIQLLIPVLRLFATALPLPPPLLLLLLGLKILANS